LNASRIFIIRLKVLPPVEAEYFALCLFSLAKRKGPLRVSNNPPELLPEYLPFFKQSFLRETPIKQFANIPYQNIRFDLRTLDDGTDERKPSAVLGFSTRDIPVQNRVFERRLPEHVSSASSMDNLDYLDDCGEILDPLSAAARYWALTVERPTEIRFDPDIYNFSMTLYGLEPSD